MQHWHSQVTVAPAIEPVTLTEAKTHLRVVGSDDDAYIGNLISAARGRAEKFTGLSIVTQTRTFVCDGFPYGDEFIALPGSPVQSVTSVVYVDGNGTNQTWDSSNYTVDTTAVPGGIYLAYGKSWPTTRTVRHAVTITYVAGYGQSSDSPLSLNVPQEIKQAILLMIAELYERREMAITGTIITEVPLSASWLLMPFRVTYL